MPTKKKSMIKHEESDFYSRFIILTTVLIIAFVPIYFNTSLFHVFALAKSTLLKIGISIIAILWSLKLVINSHRSFNANNLFSSPFSLLLPFILFLLFGLLATIFSIDPWISLVGVYGRFLGFQGYFTCFIIFLIFITLIQKTSDYLLVLFPLFLSGLIVAFYAILQYFALDPFEWFKQPFSNVFSFTGNANFCGNYLALTLPLNFFFFFYLQTKLRKILIVISTLIYFLGLMGSMTRGSWIGSLVSTTIFLFFLYRTHMAKEFEVKLREKLAKLSFLYQLRLRLRLIEHPILFFILFLISAWFLFLFREKPENIIYPVPLYLILYSFWPKIGHYYRKFDGESLVIHPPTGGWMSRHKFLSYLLITLVLNFFLVFLNVGLIERFYSIFNFFNTVRVYLWKDFFELIKEAPFLGFGFETYRRVFMPYKSFELAIFGGQEEHDSPHNVFLSQWGAVGLLGLLAILWIFIKAIYHLWFCLQMNTKTLDHHSSSPHGKGVVLPLSPFDQLLFMTLLSIFVGYMVWGQVAFDTTITYPALITFLSLYQARILQLERNHSLKAIHKQIFSTHLLEKGMLLLKSVHQNVPYFLGRLFFLALIPLAFFSSYYSYRYFKADHYYFKSMVTLNNFQQAFKQIGFKHPQTERLLRQAITEATEATVLNPNESHYHFHMARLFFDSYRFEPNQELKRSIMPRLKEAIREAEKHPWAPEAIGDVKVQIALLEGEPMKAIELAEENNRLAPYRLPSRIMLEKLYFQNKYWQVRPYQIDQIIANSERITQLEKNIVFSYLFLIDLYLFKKDYLAAREKFFYLEEFIQSKNDFSEKYKLGRIWRKIQDNERKAI